MAKIYLLWTCGELKCRQSMRVRMLSTRRTSIEDSILSGIRHKDFDYGGTSADTGRESMVEDFLRDCRTCKPFYDINAALRFGMVEEFEDGTEAPWIQ